MPVVPKGTALGAYGQSPLASPSPQNMLMAAAEVAQRARSMPGPQTAEPDLKAPRKRKLKVIK